ncbi:hypothetical protein BDW69DRAFT_166638 [Aspergillus filifer]
MRHIAINILKEIPTRELHASQYDDDDTTEETEFQLQTRLELVSDICSMLEVIAAAPELTTLDITWIDRKQQALLHQAIQEGALNRSYVNGFLMAT